MKATWIIPVVVATVAALCVAALVLALPLPALGQNPKIENTRLDASGFPSIELRMDVEMRGG